MYFLIEYQSSMYLFHVSQHPLYSGNYNLSSLSYANNIYMLLLLQYLFQLKFELVIMVLGDESNVTQYKSHS